MTELPIFIYHESGQKKTFAAGYKQSYVKDCVVSAEKYNSNVVFMGDESNIKIAKKGVIAEDYSNDKLKAFFDVFVNYAPSYPLEWAKGFFKRFFLAEEYLKKNNLTECVILDSDVLTYVNYTEYFDKHKSDVALCWKKNQKLKGVPYDNELSASASAHVSFFTQEALSDFTNFCIEQYKNFGGFLKEKYDAHLKYNIPGGITEMTLLYLWMKQNDIFSFQDLIEEKEGTVFDHTVSHPGGYNSEEDYEYNKERKIKKIIFIDGWPSFIKRDGEHVRVYAIHFGQSSKMYMNDYLYKNKMSLKSDARHFAEKIRGQLSHIKHNIFGMH